MKDGIPKEFGANLQHAPENSPSHPLTSLFLHESLLNTPAICSDHMEDVHARTPFRNFKCALGSYDGRNRNFPAGAIKDAHHSIRKDLR